MRTALILGATSGMARAFCRELAKTDVRLVLAGRDQEELQKLSQDLALRTQKEAPRVLAFDALDRISHPGFIQAVVKASGSLDEVYCFFGRMHEQTECQMDFKLAEEMISVNYLGAASVLEAAAQVMEKQKQGLIVGLSSVAGDRGRQSNYFYGSSKAAFSAYLQGLRNRLASSGVHVMTVKPGFVDTAMTRNLKKGLLVASPEAFAHGLMKAVRQKRDVVYLPGFWKLIMTVIRSIPEGVFKRLKL